MYSYMVWRPLRYVEYSRNIKNDEKSILSLLLSVYILIEEGKSVWSYPSRSLNYSRFEVSSLTKNSSYSRQRARPQSGRTG